MTSLATMSSIPNLVQGAESSKKSKRQSFSLGGQSSQGASSTHTPSSSGTTGSSTRRSSSVRSGNDWDYASIDNGVFERAFVREHILRKDLQRQKYEDGGFKMQPQEGDRASKDKDAKAKKSKPKGIALFRRRASTIPVEAERSVPSLTSQSDFSLSSIPTEGSAHGSYESSFYQSSMASTDDMASIAFSNFTAPSWLLNDEDGQSRRSSSTHSLSTLGRRRARSQSPSSNSSLRHQPGRTDGV